MRTHHHYIFPCGLLLLAIGTFIRYQISKRRFDRRGIAGLQQFPSYGKAVCTTLWESLLMLIGKLSFWLGIILLAVSGFDHLKF